MKDHHSNDIETAAALEQHRQGVDDAHLGERREHPLAELAKDLPDGWDAARLERLVHTLTAENLGRATRTLTDEERVIALLAYVATKRTYAARGALASAERRKGEIERLTGKPFRGIGKNEVAIQGEDDPKCPTCHRRLRAGVTCQDPFHFKGKSQGGYQWPEAITVRVGSNMDREWPIVYERPGNIYSPEFAQEIGEVVDEWVKSKQVER